MTVKPEKLCVKCLAYTTTDRCPECGSYMVVEEVPESCSACNGDRFLVVDVDATGVLRIERCDACSADTLTDADVQGWPAAVTSLAAAIARAGGGS